jgi:hypothetical protein
MNKRFIILAVLGVVLTVSVWSQVAMGKWRTHLAYNSVSQIAQSDNKIYAVSEGSLFSIDKMDGSMEFYSKVSGLNDANISRIEFDNTTKQLLIVYIDGNIDLLAAGGVINIPDLYNKQMSASKNINQINFYQNKAYLSADFGIIVLNMAKKEVADTYYIGPNASEVKVLNTTVYNGQIYAITATTIFNASISDPNLVNYQFWNQSTSYPGSGNFQNINSFAGNLYLLRGGKMYKQQTDNTWIPFQSDLNVTNFNVTNGKMNIFAANTVFLVDNQLNIKNVADVGTLTDAEYDTQNDTYWFAANALGVISYNQTGSNLPTINYYKPAGPAVNIPWNMTFSGEKLFVVPGGRWSAQYNQPGNVMMYEKGVWSNILNADISSGTGRSVTDFMNTAVDPNDNTHFYVTAYGKGLFEFRENKFYKLWDESNSGIVSIFPGNPDYMRLDGAVFDNNGNLFFASSNVAAGVKILMADGTWKELNYACTNNKPTLTKILISNQNPNQKWIPDVRSQPGFCVFDDNGTLTDQSDDKSIFLSTLIYTETDKTNHTTLVQFNPSAIYTIAQDKNGVIWAGTEQGPILFSNPSKVFDPDFYCSRVKIPRNDSSGFADYLLANEKVKAIAIDGANRKWLGTEASGVYLMSENGQQTIQHFTVSNSPLLSNDILSIAINPKTGEVFFGTGQGIVSYQGDAVEGGSGFSDVYAYPNPVRQNYNGVITITGLVADTQVKITDLNGNLICQTISNGGLATWDGKDVHGRRVSTGVYLAICANADGTQSTITKILVIN